MLPHRNVFVRINTGHCWRFLVSFFSFFPPWPHLGMEHQHMWVCANTKRSQTGHRLSTVQRSPGGQRLLWQHNPVRDQRGLRSRIVEPERCFLTDDWSEGCSFWSWNLPGYGTSSAGHVCESWRVTRSLCVASASTTKGLSAALMMGQSCTRTSLCTQTCGFCTSHSCLLFHLQ